MRQKLLLCIILCMTMAYSIAYAQVMTISGKVSDPGTGEGIPGVSVFVKGTNTGTVTDATGSYSLSASQGAILVFQAVGLASKEITVGAESVINLQMEESTAQLGEVVITSFGVERDKKAIGYAVQELKGEDLVKVRDNNVLNSLSGKLAGVQITGSSGAVGASTRIVIRGASQLTGNNQPLFVVDGIPISNNTFSSSDGFGGANGGNGAADINPDDIASLTVLPGATAAALYGTRAINGVVLITTKTGKKGQGLGVSVSQNLTFEKPFRLPKYQNQYGQGTGGQFNFVDGAGGGIADGTDESWGPRLDIGLNIPQFNSPVVNGVRQATPWVSHPDNVKNFFQTGVTSNTNLSITGGTEKASVRLSYSYADTKGILENTKLKKNTIALNTNINLTDKFSISGSGTYVKSEGNLPQGGYSAQNVMQQFIWFGRQVDISQLHSYRNADGSKYSWNYNYHNNPYFTLYENLNTQVRDRLYGNAKANYQFTDWLSAFVRMGTDFYTNLSTNRAAYDDLDDRQGSYSENSTTFKETNIDFLLSFNKQFGEKFRVGANVGGNQMNQKYQINTGKAGALAVPGVYNLSNSSVPLQTTNFSQWKRINSLYFSTEFSYNNSLFLNITGRNDWSSALPAGNNSFFYPSVNVSAVLSELLNFESKILSYAKLRAGWAKVGSDTDPYQLQNTLSFGDGFVDNNGWNASTKVPNMFVPNKLPNAALKPQNKNSWEVGTELRFLSNRITLDITYYNDATLNQIIEIPVSATSGFTTKVANAGKITNKGVAIQLNGTVIKPETKNGFQWDVAVNFARNVNRVAELVDGVDNIVLGTYWSLQILAKPGQPYGTLFGYGFQRDPSGNVIHQNGLPLRDPNLKVLGNYTPDWIGGINNQFSYKGITAGFLLDVRKGGSLYSMTSTWGRYSGVLEETVLGREGGIVGDGVKANGDGTFSKNDVVVTSEQYNKAAFVNTLAEPSIFDASFVKLREARLGYTLPNKLFGSKLPFRDITLSVIGRNLWLIYSKVPHIDPETAFSNGNVQGIEFGQIPSTRSVGFNLTFKLN